MIYVIYVYIHTCTYIYISNRVVKILSIICLMFWKNLLYVISFNTRFKSYSSLQTWVVRMVPKA